MEILLILVVALVLFGPAKLPELGKSLGKGIREFKRGTQGLKEELEFSLKDDDAGQQRRAAAQPAPQPMPQQPAPQQAEAQQPVPPQTVISAQGGGVSVGAEASAFQPQNQPAQTQPQPVRAASMAVTPDAAPSAPTAHPTPAVHAEADSKDPPHRA